MFAPMCSYIPTSLTAAFLISLHCPLCTCLAAVLFLVKAKDNRLKLEDATTRHADDLSMNPHAMKDHNTTAVPQLTTATVNINLSKGAIPIIINIILKIGGIIETSLCICFGPNSRTKPSTPLYLLCLCRSLRSL